MVSYWKSHKLYVIFFLFPYPSPSTYLTSTTLLVIFGKDQPIFFTSDYSVCAPHKQPLWLHATGAAKLVSFLSLFNVFSSFYIKKSYKSSAYSLSSLEITSLLELHLLHVIFQRESRWVLYSVSLLFWIKTQPFGNVASYNGFLTDSYADDS